MKLTHTETDAKTCTKTTTHSRAQAIVRLASLPTLRDGDLTIEWSAVVKLPGWEVTLTELEDEFGVEAPFTDAGREAFARYALCEALLLRESELRAELETWRDDDDDDDDEYDEDRDECSSCGDLYAQSDDDGTGRCEDCQEADCFHDESLAAISELAAARGFRLYASRPEMDASIYCLPARHTTAKGGCPRWLRVENATGKWTLSHTKAIGDTPIRTGRGAESLSGAIARHLEERAGGER